MRNARKRNNTTYPFPSGVVESFQFHDIRMPYNPHDLQLTVLQRNQLPSIRQRDVDLFTPIPAKPTLKRLS